MDNRYFKRDITPGEDKLVTLEITDPAKFWSISKYLVIRK